MGQTIELDVNDLTERWVCEVQRSGYHNGAVCDSRGAHEGKWSCGIRYELSWSRAEYLAHTDPNGLNAIVELLHDNGIPEAFIQQTGGGVMTVEVARHRDDSMHQGMIWVTLNEDTGGYDVGVYVDYLGASKEDETGSQIWHVADEDDMIALVKVFRVATDVYAQRI